MSAAWPHFKRLGLAGLVAYGPMILIHAMCITGHGGWAIAGVELFSFVPAISLLVAMITVPFLCRARTQPHAFATLVVSSGLVALFLPALELSMQLRSVGFRLAARRAAPLIAAIERHVLDTGRPPERLELLVPKYLSALPTRLPDLELIAGEKARGEYGGNSWVLVSLVPTGIVNWDLFMYFPNQQYPATGYGGWIERIDRWAYVHE